MGGCILSSIPSRNFWENYFSFYSFTPKFKEKIIWAVKNIAEDKNGNSYF
jgi:hypothetical protein